MGRYALHGELATGGMATVHFGRLLGPVGFSRTVAIKRLHPQFARDPAFVSMFLDEARLAARIQHPNVVATLDVVASQGELFLVLEYVAGETLARLERAARASGRPVPPDVVSAVLAGALHGLHAAHEATNERGEPLGLVHRDVSPQNILVGRDGTPRVLDFGVAKAAGRFHTTQDKNVKGKVPYMSPEQLRGHAVDRTTDVYAAGVVLWEALASRRLFKRDDEPAMLHAILFDEVSPPSLHAHGLPPSLDAVVLRALERDPAKRFPTAREFALALERAMPPALASAVGAWVDGVAGPTLQDRAVRIAELESSTTGPADVNAMLASIQEPEPSQTSGITTTGAAMSVAPRKGALAAAIGAGLAVLLLAVLLLGFVLGGRRTSPPPGEPPPAVASAAPAAPTVLPPPPPTFQPEPAASSAPAAIAAPPPKPKVAPPAKPKPDCQPPFRIGPDGEKIYKRECIP